MRKRRAEKRYIKPDPKFNDVTVSKFINVLMNDGKKSAARKIIYGAFDIIEGKTKKTGLEIFKQALSNVQPIIEVRS
jgi:small subunit ribosomal protein S7